jgi:hypothetical protein
VNEHSQRAHETSAQSELMHSWSLRGALAAMLVAGAVAAIGGAAIYAATGASMERPGMQFAGPPAPTP